MSNENTRMMLQPVLAELADVAGRVTEDQRDLPTPCEDFDVTDLTAHIVGWLENFAAGFADPDGACPMGDVSGVQVSREEAQQRIIAAAQRFDQALQDGAADRPLSIQGQGMPGEMALSMILAEYLLHGWDLAVATGQDWNLSEDAVRSAHEFLREMVTPEYRGPGGMFGPEVPVHDDAPGWDRLLGFSGRNPRWTS